MHVYSMNGCSCPSGRKATKKPDRVTNIHVTVDGYSKEIPVSGEVLEFLSDFSHEDRSYFIHEALTIAKQSWKEPKSIIEQKPTMEKSEEEQSEPDPIIKWGANR